MTTIFSKRRLILLSLSLAYIALGILGSLPAASLLQLAHNTHVSLSTIGILFTFGSLSFIIGASLAGLLTRWITAKYLLIAGLGLMTTGSLIIPLAEWFPLLLLSGVLRSCGMAFIDASLNTIATVSFEETLSENLSTIHGMFGVGALAGPLLLALGLLVSGSLIPAYYLGAAVAIFTLLLVSGLRISSSPKSRISEEQEEKVNRVKRRTVLRQPLLWLMILQISLYNVAEVGFGAWIVTLVSLSARINLILAAPVATAFYIGLTAGRFSGAQILGRKWLSENKLIYIAILGGVASGLLVAFYAGMFVLAYILSIMVGFFFGPLFPNIMAITSRRFSYAIGTVSSVMMVGSCIWTLIVPAMMGVLVPLLGTNKVIAIPALFCLALLIPTILANRTPIVQEAQ
jgi:MFS transporter, DHA1 family, purine base/nucleoside efflux pump